MRGAASAGAVRLIRITRRALPWAATPAARQRWRMAWLPTCAEKCDGRQLVGQIQALECRWGPLLRLDRRPTRRADGREGDCRRTKRRFILLYAVDMRQRHRPLDLQSILEQTFDQMHIVLLHGNTVASEILDNLAVQVIFVPVVASPLDPPWSARAGWPEWAQALAPVCSSAHSVSRVSSCT